MLVLGGLISVAYASTTIITDTGITTTNLTVLGVCTGCGAGEGSYTTYSNILNGTVATTNGWGIEYINTSDNGTTLFQDAGNRAVMVKSDGTVITTQTVVSAGLNNVKTIDKSLTGKYKIIWVEANQVIKLYKNDILLQNIGVKSSQCTIGGGSRPGVSISSSGQYISFQCIDSAGINDRLEVFKGT